MIDHIVFQSQRKPLFHDEQVVQSAADGFDHASIRTASARADADLAGPIGGMSGVHARRRLHRPSPPCSVPMPHSYGHCVASLGCAQPPCRRGGLGRAEGSRGRRFRKLWVGAGLDAPLLCPHEGAAEVAFGQQRVVDAA